MAALKYWVWLQTLEGLLLLQKWQLMEHFHSPEDIYFAEPEEILQVEGLQKDHAAALTNKSMETADRVLAECAKKDIFIVTTDDALYPTRLRNIYQPPLLLYGKGRMPMFDEEVALTIVGTRSCTPYGIQTAEELGYELTRQGAMVVSGMAKGIDGAALRGALRAGGFTAALLGCGVDVIYPAENRNLYEDIAATGVLLSEYPPQTDPEPWHFPQRNRIMSGLSLGTVVVEAKADHSGALITAHAAAEQGRDVFAVPGPVNAPASAGCHQLIRQGAVLVTSGWDILEEYQNRYPHKLHQRGEKLPPLPQGSDRPETPPVVPEKTKASKLPTVDLAKNREHLTDDQIAVLRILPADAALLCDEVAELTEIPVRRVLSALTVLEIDGFVAKSGARCFVRCVDIKDKEEGNV